MSGMAPSQDNSDHPDDIPFSVGNPDLNLYYPLFATVTGKGATPNK